MYDLIKLSSQRWQIYSPALDKLSPKFSSLLRIFNRKAVKVSYSFIENVSQMIKRDNKRVTKTRKRQIESCNYRQKNDFPLNGNCRVKNAVYKSVVFPTEKSKEHLCIGIAEGFWIQCYYNHTISIRDQKWQSKVAKPFEVFYGSLRNQQKKSLSLHSQFYRLY